MPKDQLSLAFSFYLPYRSVIAPKGWTVLGTRCPRGDLHIGVPLMFSTPAAVRFGWVIVVGAVVVPAQHRQVVHVG